MTMPAKEDMPSTVARSGRKARATWGQTHDAAVEQYGEGERSHRTAFASLKHTHEKVGDHWEPKDKKGPSDKKAAGGRGSKGKTAEGVDANASKEHLQQVAKRVGVKGRTKMKKSELVDAIKKANRKASAKSR
jgi:hypothetical protein